MIFSSFIDYAAGLIIDKYDDNQKKANGGFAGFFDNKSGASWSFQIQRIFCRYIWNRNKAATFTYRNIVYTFQSMSYTIDMYMRKIKVQRSFLNFATYVSLFPQIVAGPIVRYEDVQNEIDSRKTNIFLLGEGAGIFVRGLSKRYCLQIISGFMDGNQGEWNIRSFPPQLHG